MATEALEAILRMTAAGSLAVLLVLALRAPARRWFGPEVSYRLWAWPPLATLGVLLPAHMVGGAAGPLETPFRTLAQAAANAGVLPWLGASWLAGALVAASYLAIVQTVFMRKARKGLGGPAVVGVINPRLILPVDPRYGPAERTLIRAHELEHIRRNDPRANALAALTQVLFWFNPLTTIAGWALRLDQELACDAAVMRGRPARQTYARALLKAQMLDVVAPLACPWPAAATHPLLLRLRELSRPPPSGPRQAIGELMISAAWAGLSLTAWAATVIATLPRLYG